MENTCSECTECGGTVVLRRSEYGYFYRCNCCNASVGCHPNSKRPLGTLAGPELKAWRIKVHEEFDALRERIFVDRRESYKWMADAMGLTADQAHIGMFNIDQCKRLVELVREVKR